LKRRVPVESTVIDLRLSAGPGRTRAATDGCTPGEGDADYRPPALETYLKDVGEKHVETVPLTAAEGSVATP